MRKLKKTRKTFSKQDFSSKNKPVASDLINLLQNLQHIFDNSLNIKNQISAEDAKGIWDKIEKSVPQHIEEKDHLQLIQNNINIIFTEDIKKQYTNDIQKIIRDIQSRHNQILLKLNYSLEELEITRAKIKELSTIQTNTSNTELEDRKTSLIKHILSNNYINDSTIINIINEIKQELSYKEIEVLCSLIKEHYRIISLILKKKFTNEVSLVKELDSALKDLLIEFNQLYIPNRKNILKWLALKCSEDLKDFHIVSPEDFSKVDPNYHNIVGKKGMWIDKSISFLFIRKSNQKVFIKADVSTA